MSGLAGSQRITRCTPDTVRKITDDEDDSNANQLTGDFIGSEVFLSAGHNTTLHLPQVNPTPSGVFVLGRDLSLRLAP